MEEKTYKQMKQEFIDFYQNKVYKRLKSYNSKRKKAALVNVFLQVCLISISLALLFGALGILFGELFYNLFFICFGIFWISGMTVHIISRGIRPGNANYSDLHTNFEAKLKSPLMGQFVKIFFEDGRWGRNIKPHNSFSINKPNKDIPFEAKLFRLKLLNPFPYLFSDDRIAGTFKGVNLFIYEANTNIFGNYMYLFIIVLLVNLTYVTAGLIWVFIAVLALIFIRKIDQYSPFHGVIVEFDMNKNFNGHTVFYENSSIAKKIPLDKKKFQKVNLESVTFEQKYNVYSDDQIEARYLLTTAFMERIENLNLAFKAEYVRGSFKDNKLTLAIHTGKDMFAMGSDFKDSDSNTFAILYDEMISILQIVDQLKLDQKIGL